MNVKRRLLHVLAFAVTLTVANTARAQTDFFWSFDSLNSGASNVEPVRFVDPGVQGTLFLYYTTNGPADSDVNTGMILDIIPSPANVVFFGGILPFDFDILFQGVDIDNRWLDDQGSGGGLDPGSFQPDGSVLGFSVFTAGGGTGILEENNGQGSTLDTGYDSGADAFLIGRFDYNIVGGDGSVVHVDVVPFQVVDSGQLVETVQGTVTIVIGDIVFGDINGDDLINLLDVQPFIDVVASGEYNPHADLNQDGMVNLLDVALFIEALAGK